MIYGIGVVFTEQHNYEGLIKTDRGWEKWIANDGLSVSWPRLPAKTFTDLNEAFMWKEQKRADGWSWYHLVKEYIA